MSVICVDISNYQAGFNFGQFKSSGGLGVIAKATEGTSVQDKSYKTFRQGALNAGLAFASYHFFRSSNPTQQADYYYGFAQPAPGERVVCDFEDDSCTVANMVTFLKRLQAIDPTLQLTVYSGHTIKQQLTAKNDWLAANTSLWLAQYTSGTPSWPTSTWPQWSLWQYSDQLTAPGFKGPVDQNRFNGSDDNFLKWMGPAGIAPPQPGPPVAQATVNVTLTSDTPVNLVITAGENVTIANVSDT